MKKIIALVLSCLLLSSFCACTARQPADSVTSDGSTSMEELIGILAEAFALAHPDVKFTNNPTGSSSGISAVLDGRCDIGLSSRALKQQELEQGLVGTTLALDGIAVIVNPDNPVSDLTTADLAAIYTGEIDNWAQLGGNDAPIVRIGREAGSGTRDGFESITDTKDACQYRQELTGTGDVIVSVSQNPDAIGYASVSAVSQDVKTLLIEGVAPDEASIRDGSYAITRPFVLVTKQDTPLSEAAQAFFDYATSEAAAPLIARAGAVCAN